MLKSVYLSSFIYPKEKWLVEDVYKQSYNQQNNYKK
jgi:hypothetical protein